MLPILVATANGERPPLPFTPPFVTDIINRMMADIDETIIKQWNLELHEAIPQGKKILKRFLESNYINTEKKLGFKFIDMTEEGIKTILTKKIEYVNDKTDSSIPIMIESLSNIGYGSHDSAILVQSLEGIDKYGRLTKNHYVLAIYLKDLKI